MAIKDEVVSGWIHNPKILEREADEQRRKRAEEEFESASERLAESQAELAKLRAEFSALPRKI